MSLEIGEVYERGGKTCLAISADRLLTRHRNRWRELAANGDELHKPAFEFSDLERRWSVSANAIDEAMSQRLLCQERTRRRLQLGDTQNLTLPFNVIDLWHKHGTSEIYQAHFRACFYRHLERGSNDDNAARSWERFKRSLRTRGVPHERGLGMGPNVNPGGNGSYGRSSFVKLSRASLAWAERCVEDHQLRRRRKSRKKEAARGK